MRVIGVTGGIGSGKSTVSRILEKLGARVIDADIIAREIVCKGEKALAEIEAFFGSDVLDANGELDRKKLGNIVFNDSEKLDALNKITHKYIRERILKYLEQAEKEGKFSTLVIDAAIPFEHGFLDTADEIWVVAADIDIRVERVEARSGLSRQEVINRISSQMSDEEYFKLADKIIYNNGNSNILENEVIKMLESG